MKSKQTLFYVMIIIFSAAGCISAFDGKGWFEFKSGALFETMDGFNDLINTTHYTDDVWGADFGGPVFPLAVDFSLYFSGGWDIMFGASYYADRRRGTINHGNLNIIYNSTLNQTVFYAGARYYWGKPGQENSPVFYAGTRYGLEMILDGTLRYDGSSRVFHFNETYHCAFFEAGCDWWVNRSLGFGVNAGIKLAGLSKGSMGYSGIYVEAGLLYDLWQNFIKKQ